MNAIPILMILLGSIGLAQAYEAAYPMTAAGFCEIKTLPAGTILRTSSEKAYFEENNGLFMRLFRTINDNQVPRTLATLVPVAPVMERVR